MRISAHHLPPSVLKRLHEAIKHKPYETFVFRSRKGTVASYCIAVSILSIALLAFYADGLRWNQLERATVRGIVTVAVVALLWSLQYSAKWWRSTFPNCTLINPQYLIRFRPKAVEVIDVGEILHTSFHTIGPVVLASLTTSTEVIRFAISDPVAAAQLQRELPQFSTFRENLERRGDFDALDGFDLLKGVREAAWRQVPASTVRTVATACFFVAALCVGVTSFQLLDRFNDRRDDEHRWAEAAGRNTAASYREYLAVRVHGRYAGEASQRIDAIYSAAEQKFKPFASQSQGAAAMLALLQYAHHTGTHKVAVVFSSNIDLPNELEQSLKELHKVKKVAPPQEHFTPAANKQREQRVIDALKAAVDRLMPGELLTFEQSKTDPSQPVLLLSYEVASDGRIYFLTEQENLPEAERDWIASIAFDWKFAVDVPGNTKPFTFAVSSSAADQFDSDESGVSLTTADRYEGMARSAFSQFQEVLISELTIHKREAASGK